MFKKFVIFIASLALMMGLFGQKVFAETEVVLDKTVVHVADWAVKVINKEWICGLGDYPNEMTRNLKRLFQFTLEHLDLDKYGNPCFRSAKIEYEEKSKNSGYTYTTADKMDLINAKKIYVNNHWKLSGMDSVYYLAKQLVALDSDVKKLYFCFSSKIGFYDLDVKKDWEKREWKVSPSVTLYPGTFNFSVDESEKKEFTFEGCYKIKHLLEIANAQIEMAKEFLKQYDAAVKRLKLLRKLETKANK